MDRVQRSPAASATIGACGPNVELRAVVGATIGACGPNEDVRDVVGAIAGAHGPNVEGMDVVEVCIASGAICDERAVVGASGANIGTCGSNEDVRDVVGAIAGAGLSEWTEFKDRPAAGACGPNVEDRAHSSAVVGAGRSEWTRFKDPPECMSVDQCGGQLRCLRVRRQVV